MTGFPLVAAAYWDRQLPIIPLEPRQKTPMVGLKGWPGYLADMPSDAVRKQWLSSCSDHGIGLLLGGRVLPDHFLVAIDADDDRHQRMLGAFLSLKRGEIQPILCGKRGKKGVTYFVLVPAAKPFKSKVLKGFEGLGNIDVLAGGKYTAMPPGLHPDTGRPYEVVGRALVDTEFGDLPVLAVDKFKVLGATIASEHTLTLLGGTATHDAGVAFVAQLVSAGASDEEIEVLVRGLLPEDYAGDSLDELPEWIRSAREKFARNGNAGDAESRTELLLKLCTAAEIDLFHDGDGNAFATVPSGNGTATHRVTSLDFSRWLRHEADSRLGEHVTGHAIKEACNAIEVRALYQQNVCSVHNRVGGDRELVEIDLGTRDGRVVQITQGGWELVNKPSLKFIRGAGFLSLPDPVPGGNLEELKILLRLDDTSFQLLLAFLLNALSPTGPYFILLVEGEQGSGKSFFCQIIKMIIDPNKAPKMRLPDNERDLMIHAKEYRLLNYDNASGMRADISDTLCTLATGGALAVRQLYTDGGLYVMSYTRPFVINGISGFAKRPDLMERAIPIKLKPIQQDTRDFESEMLKGFEAMLPRILGVLNDAIACAIRNYRTVEPPRHLRMADAARWVAAGAPALGFESGVLLNAITVAQDDLVVARVNDDALVIKLREITRDRPFEGYIGSLFKATDASSDRTLPQSSARLSNFLDRYRPAMAKAGVHVEFLSKDRNGRRIRITSTADGPSEPIVHEVPRKF